jgi:uncharacterized coiled-coil protein SlyX
MSDFSDLERRIERLRNRAASGPLTAQLVAEIEDVLTEGYISALQADARSRRLRERVDALVDDPDAPPAAEEVRQLGSERRMLEQSVHALRKRLSGLQSLVAGAAGPRTRSA